MSSKKKLKLSKEFWADFSNSTITALLDLSEAIAIYNRAKPIRAGLRGDVILKIGVSELYEFGVASGVPLLIIPSMINKAYIMDLPESSFIESLCDKGFRVYAIEWGNPESDEEIMDLNDYIVRINQFVDYLSGIRPSKSPLVLLGYCMGGIMASLYVSKYAEKVKSVVHLGTPWNFDVAGFMGLNPNKLMKFFHDKKVIPKDFFQFSFYITKFADVNRKYLEFKRQRSNNHASNHHDFACIESWVNDGIDMPKGVFKQFVGEIIHQNKLTAGKLNLRNVIYNIDSCVVPTLSIVATKDSLIPISSSTAINSIKPRVDLSYFNTGHVGLVTSTRNDVAETIKLWHLQKVYKEVNKQVVI